MMKTKTTLKPDTNYDHTPYRQMYLALFEAAYGLESPDSSSTSPGTDECSSLPRASNQELNDASKE